MRRSQLWWLRRLQEIKQGPHDQAEHTQRQIARRMENLLDNFQQVFRNQDLSNVLEQSFPPEHYLFQLGLVAPCGCYC